MRNVVETRLDGATVWVATADARLGQRMVRSIAASVRKKQRELGAPPTGTRVVRWRTSARLASLEGEGLAGALAIIRVTQPNLRRLSSFIDRAKAGGVIGIQLVWDGETPGRDVAEAYVFAELERGRARPREAPVVLARSLAPAQGLVWMAHVFDVARRARVGDGASA